MFRPARPYVPRQGSTDPWSATRARSRRPRDGDFLRTCRCRRKAHEAIELLSQPVHRPLLRRRRAVRRARDARLRRRTRSSSTSTCTRSATSRLARRPPTKLVTVGEPEELAALGSRCAKRLRRWRLHVESLPFLLEFGNASVSKGTGAAFVADRSASPQSGRSRLATAKMISSCSTGRLRDRRRVSASAAARAIADWVCPRPDEEGVARWSRPS